MKEGFTADQMIGMRDVTELKNSNGTVDTYCIDGNLLTAVGKGFIKFGIEFGKMLNLTFDPNWYGEL
jgi:4-methyl-5(b-hydroxyethyl)-thiazole monophosphate biosynthesis